MELRKLEEVLLRYLTISDGAIQTKQYVERIGDLKIHIWPGDHDPPHFHVYSTQRKIDATFHLYTYEVRTDKTNKITRRDEKRIQEFFKMPDMQKKLEEIYIKMQEG